jgi:putative addiction module killer protein
VQLWEISGIASQLAKASPKCVFMLERAIGSINYVRTGSTIYVLLVGGDKSSQAKDISHAKKMARELKETKQ